MRLRLWTTALALILLAGCGGGSSSEAEKPTKATTTAPAPAKDYSLEQLKAALPDEKSSPEILKVGIVCPGGDEAACAGAKDAETARAYLDLKPSAAGAPAVSGPMAGITDSLTLTATRFDSPEAATKEQDSARAATADYDGSYDLDEKVVGEGRRIAEKGTGSVEDLESGGWTGLIASRAGTGDYDGTSLTLQNTFISVLSGRVRITLDVVADVEGRPEGFTDEIAREVLDDYLKRLG